LHTINESVPPQSPPVLSYSEHLDLSLNLLKIRM
jgi:hypothetical protein